MAQHRILFIDRLRGLALVLMILNHSALYLLEASLDPYRHILVYLTVSLSAPLFLFMVGFSLAISHMKNTAMTIRPYHVDLQKHFDRGVLLILLGFMLNIVLSPHKPFYAGGILQTIGISIIIIAPMLRWLTHRVFRDILVLSAVISYLAFAYSQANVMRMIIDHPIIADLFFGGFPPWPWIGVVFIGLVSGHNWLALRDEAGKVDQYLLRMVIASIISLTLYFILSAWQGDMLNFNLNRDYIIRGHWLPGTITVFWSIGIICLSFVVTQRTAIKPGILHRLLVPLGQSALLLYLLHLLVIKGIADQLLGLTIDNWWSYIGFNLILMTGLVTVSYRWVKIQS